MAGLRPSHPPLKCSKGADARHKAGMTIECSGRPRLDLLPDRRQLRLVPDPDQDAAFKLKLVVGIGGDFCVAGGDVVLRMQCPVEQGRLQPRNDIGAFGVVAAIGEFMRIAYWDVMHWAK